MKNSTLTILAAAMLASCTGRVNVSGHIDQDAPIYPDYADVTAPCNIAPLNFHIDSPGEAAKVAMSVSNDTIWIDAKHGDVTIPMSKWKQWLRDYAGDSIAVSICRKEDDKWLSYRPFHIYISPDSIDSHLVYRRIPPLYGIWMKMGIYQRDLETYDECPIYENSAYHGNCVNCHSFGSRNPVKMQLHMRGKGGATYLTIDGEKRRLNTKTDSTISNFTYPYWHPSGRYIAYSVNDIFQVFHTSDPNRVEVCDSKSDIVIYDIENNTAFSSPLIKGEAFVETFPAFSADGHKLYFCQGVVNDSVPDYSYVHYSLCSIDFDPETATFGNRIDTIYDAGSMGGSISFPRPSPDGKYLVATRSGYGNFSIWHKDADLWLYDIESGKWTEMDAVNSADVESYHSWAGNSKWLTFSSRRDDGLYTRPYFTHIDAKGNASKPFMLPQKRPKKYYEDQMNSYNIPELVNGEVKLGVREMADWIECPVTNVGYK